MNKETYEQQKKQIIDQLGIPQWDMREPQNESAKRLNELKQAYHVSMMQDAKLAAKQRGQKQSPETLTDIYKQSSFQSHKTLSLPSIELEDKDLKAFSSIEAEILRAHYRDLTLNTRQLADSFNWSRQKIASLLNSMPAKVLECKVFDLITPSEVRIGLLAAIRSGDSKTILRLAEHYNLIKSEKTDLNITSKPIEDPEALKLLKELGDKLA